ncbi:hypothetical protein CR513_62812, partial [Mucuna pruriens]
MADAIISGNALTKKLSRVAKKKVLITQRQVVAIKKRNKIIREQVTTIKQSTNRVYSESDEL